MNNTIKINTKNISNNDLPRYATAGSAGMDIRANLLETVVLSPLERKLIPTGIFLEIPQGYEGQVRPRSGLALKNGITCLNSPGTIDSDYRGELNVLLINLSNIPFTINNNDGTNSIQLTHHQANINPNKVSSNTSGSNSTRSGNNSNNNSNNNPNNNANPGDDSMVGVCVQQSPVVIH